MALKLNIFPQDNVSVETLYDELCKNFEDIQWLSYSSTCVKIIGCNEYISHVLGLKFNSTKQLIKFEPRTEQLQNMIRFINQL